MIVVKPACKEDSQTIFNWRNDKLTREMSLIADTVAWEGHKIWFEKTLKSETRLLLMCSDAETNEKICVVRFDLDKDRALVSINLQPSMRGKGLGKKCLTESISYLKKHTTIVKFLDADIKTVNHASIATYEGAGFFQVGKDEDLLRFEYKI